MYYRILHVTDRTIHVAHELLVKDEGGVDIVDSCLLHEGQSLCFAYLRRPYLDPMSRAPPLAIVSLRRFTTSIDNHDLNQVPEVILRLNDCKDVSGISQ